MDNRTIDITSEGKDAFHMALSLFDPPGKKVVGYKATAKRLTFFWMESSSAGYTKLLYPLTIPQAADFALGWLATVDYGREPDHDGSNGKGWRLFNDTWGRIDGDSYAFAAIEPAWAMYGK